MVKSVMITPTIEHQLWNDFQSGKFTMVDLCKKYTCTVHTARMVVERRYKVDLESKAAEYATMAKYQQELFEFICGSECPADEITFLKMEYKRVGLWLELNNVASYE
jgi:hypothetical protein